MTDGPLLALVRALDDAGPLAIAVSGGVDSMTLAVAASRHAKTSPLIVHAVSPAVPPEATARVRAQAALENWDLRIGDAGEFSDPAYRANPVNRCFYCKTNLYGFIAAMTDRRIASGTNMDDLGDYRPGLVAARDHDVTHPFVQAGMTKAMVRALARSLQLAGIAELPAAPCLASRIATGLEVTQQQMSFVHLVERKIQECLSPATVRCRVFSTGVVVQLDTLALERVPPSLRAALARICIAHGYLREPSFQPYRQGSAFLHPAAP